jgi:adenylate cyclase class IV
VQNVEYKAELRDLFLAHAICRNLGADFAGTIEQTDTYYRVPDARLKKRETPGATTEYIFYNRINRTRPKLSSYTIYTELQALERFGSSPLPVWVVVRKTRELHLYRGVRIHLDHVETLGRFLEFEVIVRPDQNLAQCHALMDFLRQSFGPACGEPIACSYADLIAAESGHHTPT